ncbi:MAG: Hsp20/alpha crystallin family protein [Kiritimatiellae bacterium]|nr:Hsp20/alpha crystallin family protein [Kiritimatiellia bacterium]
MMSNILQFDPWDLLEEITGAPQWRTLRNRACGRFPPANVYANAEKTLVEMELTGKCAKDVDLTLEAQALVIADKPAEGRQAAWSRRVNLPYRIDAGKVSAKFEDGILRVELPKEEAEGVRKIEIA